MDAGAVLVNGGRACSVISFIFLVREDASAPALPKLVPPIATSPTLRPSPSSCKDDGAELYPDCNRPEPARLTARQMHPLRGLVAILRHPPGNITVGGVDAYLDAADRLEWTLDGLKIDADDMMLKPLRPLRFFAAPPSAPVPTPPPPPRRRRGETKAAELTD